MICPTTAPTPALVHGAVETVEQPSLVSGQSIYEVPVHKKN